MTWRMQKINRRRLINIFTLHNIINTLCVMTIYYGYEINSDHTSLTEYYWCNSILIYLSFLREAWLLNSQLELELLRYLKTIPGIPSLLLDGIIHKNQTKVLRLHTSPPLLPHLICGTKL